ncbi:TPA: DNA cytosine methyltransferase [Klebsiella pneumoniae]
MTASYYNEWDASAAAWLRELINNKLIPYGYVDERSITEVTPSDLEGFTQCHFFAGIGGWPLALQLAGIPASTQLWTGSPPCQPFSVAGKSLGFDDERHLAPAFLRLIRECKPQLLFGEQVAAAIGRHWLDFVFLNLEDKGYACGSAVLPACSVGAPHKRDRLFFGAMQLGDTNSERHNWQYALLQREGQKDMPEATRTGEAGRIAQTNCEQQRQGCCTRKRTNYVSEGREQDTTASAGFCSDNATNPHHGFWSDADWIGCRDGKFRPVEAWTQQMVDGVPGGMGHSGDPCVAAAFEEIGFPLGKDIPARVARLRGYGNAIVPQCAAEFIAAFRGAIEDLF